MAQIGHGVRVTGLKETISFMRRLPNSIQKEVKQEGVLDLAKNLQARMRRRAPMGPTGWLRRSIMIEKNGHISVVVNAYYGQAVEEGRSDNTYIPRFYMEQHIGLPEAPGQRIDRQLIRTTGGYFLPSSTRAGIPRPFTRPALDSLRPKIPSLLSIYLGKAISRAKQR